MMNESQQRMFEENYGLIYYALRYFGDIGNMEKDDREQILAIGLMKAVIKYDSSKAKFATFAMNVMKNELLMAIRGEQRKWEYLTSTNAIRLDDYSQTCNEKSNLLFSEYYGEEDKEIVKMEENGLLYAIKDEKWLKNKAKLSDKEYDLITKMAIDLEVGEIAKMNNRSQSYTSKIKKRAITKILDTYYGGNYEDIGKESD